MSWGFAGFPSLSSTVPDYEIHNSFLQRENSVHTQWERGKGGESQCEVQDFSASSQNKGVARKGWEQQGDGLVLLSGKSQTVSA